MIATSTGAYLSASGTWTNASDVNRKHRFADVSGEDVLARLRRIPVQTWSYRTDPDGVRHIGPTAQDFRAAFGLGQDSISIATVDADAGRVTIDRDLRWVSGHGTAEVGDVLVVETKSATVRPGPLDRRLWELGHRPTRISKYGTGLALLTPDLQRNRWHRVTSQHLAAHVTLRPAVLS